MCVYLETGFSGIKLKKEGILRWDVHWSHRPGPRGGGVMHIVTLRWIISDVGFNAFEWLCQVR